MVKKKSNKKEQDSVYFLKILMFFILGSVWISFVEPGIPIPIGLGLGLVFARHEHFQIDRKVEYAVLLVAAILSFMAPIGAILEL